MRCVKLVWVTGSLGHWVMGHWVMGHACNGSDGSWVTVSDPWSTLIIRVGYGPRKFWSGGPIFSGKIGPPLKILVLLWTNFPWNLVGGTIFFMEFWSGGPIFHKEFWSALINISMD